MYSLRHTLFLGGILTHLSHLGHLNKGVAKSILYATPVFVVLQGVGEVFCGGNVWVKMVCGRWI
jgi:hypothetical protein